MSFGFQTWRASGTLQIDTDTIGVLYIDDFDVSSGSVVKTYTGLAGVNLTVAAKGNTTMSPGATITQADSGGNRQVTVTVARAGKFTVMVEE